MSAESSAFMYKGGVSASVGNETVLGTPVPVAHSTAVSSKYSAYNRNGRAYFDKILPTSPAFLKQTYVIEGSKSHQNRNIQDEGNKETSILNIDAIKGLSDSVLDRSLHEVITKKLSEKNQIKQLDTFNVEHCQSPSTDIETEQQKIRFDDEELKMLEDAFSDFDCDTSETTIPTRACGTFARRVSCKPPATGEECSEGNTTSVPSLQSAEGSGEADGSIVDVEAQDPAQPHVVCPATGPSTQVSEGHPDNTIDKQLSSQTKGVDQSLIRSRVKLYSHLPCLTGLSSALESNSFGNKSDNCVPPELPKPTTNLNANISASLSSVHDVNRQLLSHTNSHLANSADANNISQAPQEQISKHDLSENASHDIQKVDNAMEADDTILGNLDMSKIDISCLHMSDIDGLLDMITALGKQSKTCEPATQYNKVCSQFTKQVAAVRQALKPAVSNTIGSNKIIYSSEGKQANFPSSKVDGGKENVPPANDDMICSEKENLSVNRKHSQHSNSLRSNESTDSPIRYLPKVGHENLSINKVSITPQKDAVSSEMSKAEKIPILSNTDCLIWAGAVCGQMQRKSFLIKHKMDKPVTLSFAIRPKSEVFKLVDENGYLIAGMFRVHLPPNLEYEVNVAYVGKHPVSWDFANLVFRLEDETLTRTSKVRLIGYTNSSELVYYCCSKLSSNVYWTVASKVDPICEMIDKKIERTSLQSPKSCLTSNLSGCCLARITVSNFGARSAWVCARVECLDQKSDDQKDCNEFSDNGIVVDPENFVIGSKQSESISITLKPGVKAARIVLYHGDEILRYQFRQLYTQSQKTSKHEKRSSHSEKGSRLRLLDILKDFAHEQSIQVVELPSASHNDLRPQDWRQALIDQVHHCEPMYLYIYASKEDQASSCFNQLHSVCESLLESSLASVFVQRDAFKQRSSLNSALQDCTLSLSSKSLSKRSSLQEACPPATNLSPSIKDTNRRELSDLQSPKIKLIPSNTLVFPSCVHGCSTEAYFSVSLVEQTSNFPIPSSSSDSPSLWKVFWSANPVTDVQVKRPTVHSSCSVSKRLTLGRDVFQLMHTKTDSLKFAILSSDPKKAGHGQLIIPFLFKPVSSHENTMFQDWHLNFWIEPYSQNKSRHEVQYNPKDSVTLLVTLEGSCCKQPTINKRSPCAPLQNTCNSKLEVSPSSLSKDLTFNDRNVSLSRGSAAKSVPLGLLDIVGLPVKFEIIDSKSTTTKTHFHNIMLINRLKTAEVFVKLQLPNPPFYMTEPKETRFRIAPRSRVKLVLSFQPYDLGRASSVLGIRVECRNQTEADKPTVDTFQIHLFGTMN
ncbi:unnamed protein product [Trichobilharzia szidati]|nr:unnamed protein product [Trichobilharzia szidati]